MEKKMRIPEPLLIITAIFWAATPLILGLIKYAGGFYSFGSPFESPITWLIMWVFMAALHLYIPLVFIFGYTAIAARLIGGQTSGAEYAVYPFSLIYTAAYLVLVLSDPLAYTYNLSYDVWPDKILSAAIIIIPLCTAALLCLLLLGLKLSTSKSIAVSVIFMVLFALSAASSWLGVWLFDSFVDVLMSV